MDIESLSPLTWSYIGDSVYELHCREKLVLKNGLKPGKLHKLNIKRVSAKAQSRLLGELKKYLNENELNIVRRGRNTNPKTFAKNASIKEYLNATGIEALFGYLYLKKENKRLEELLNICDEIEGM